MDRAESEKGVGEHPEEGRKGNDVKSMSPAVDGEADKGQEEEGEEGPSLSDESRNSFLQGVTDDEVSREKRE
jgi:hypothetical protein